MFFPRTPVLFIDFSKNKKFSEYQDLLTGLNEIQLTTLIIPPLGILKLPQGKYLHYIHAYEKEQAFLAADFVMVLDDSIEPVWAKGCVPLGQLNGDGTEEYNPLQEKGNGFFFKNPTKWEIFATIVRAIETYQFPYDWENLLRGILREPVKSL